MRARWEADQTQMRARWEPDESQMRATWKPDESQMTGIDVMCMPNPWVQEVQWTTCTIGSARRENGRQLQLLLAALPPERGQHDYCMQIRYTGWIQTDRGRSHIIYRILRPFWRHWVCNGVKRLLLHSNAIYMYGGSPNILQHNYWGLLTPHDRVCNAVFTLRVEHRLRIKSNQIKSNFNLIVTCRN